MPVYDYRCIECDGRFEVTRPMGAPTATCCPSCGSAAKRVFTPVGVAFKGSGFHNTDYKKRPGDDTKPSAPACSSASEGSSACATCPAATE
jgi:putative FmdB family regulatory protein